MGGSNSALERMASPVISITSDFVLTYGSRPIFFDNIFYLLYTCVFGITGRVEDNRRGSLSAYTVHP